LVRTENNLADEILTAAIDSPHPAIRDMALRAVLGRPTLPGHREVFRRLPQFDEHCREIVGEHAERLVGVVAETIRSGDLGQFDAACDAILSFRLYEALPVLVAELNRDKAPYRRKVARTIRELTDLFYGELCNPDPRARCRDLDTTRKRITSALEDAALNFGKHGAMEVVEAFLLVTKQQNIVLRRILRQPRETSHRAVVDALSTSSEGGVLRLLLSFLEDPQMPQVVRNILAGRTDKKFVENLVVAGGTKASKTVTESLLRFDGFAWAEPGHPVWADLDDQGQADAVALLMASSIPRKQLVDLIGYLLLEGKVGGRRAAASAIAAFKGPEANIAVIKALNDEDPVVRAHVLRQLRPRNIPEAMLLLIRMVDTPHDEVRRALRESLPEFTFRRFIHNFERLPDRLVMTAGQLVRKIDADAPRSLKAEMECLSPVRRRRAVLAASAMGLVRDMEGTIIRLLSDDDHIVRIAAARALAECDTVPSWEALRDALLDRSVIVQETAEQSLLQIAQSLVEREEQPEEEMEEAAV
jgi:HEAT repeat protein